MPQYVLIIAGIGFGICVLGMLFCLYMLYRNDRVFEYRTALAEQVFSFVDYKWRQEVLNSVSYGDMTKKFWKPLDSFYPDKSFIKEK